MTFLGGNRIKGITIEIDGDVKKLNDALKSTTKELNSTQSKLRDVERMLKLDPSNTELLAQKQRLLGDAINTTSGKLEVLKKAEEQAAAKLENGGKEALDQYEALRREIIQTERTLSNLGKQAEETEAAIKTAGEKTADGVEDIANEAKGAEKALEDVEDATADVKKEADGFGDVFKANLAVEGIKEICSTLKDVTEESREYRNEMSKLQTAYETNNHSAETAKQTYDELYAILGETDRAVEAANHLALLTNNEAQLAQWTEIAAGVYGTFGASLPIESLTEAANETSKTGQITGALADALNWAGIQEAAFQAKLDHCSTAGERATLITNTLSQAYDGAAKSFRKTNKDIIESNKANGKLQDSLAKLGKKVEPIIATLTKTTSNLINTLSDGSPVVTGLITAMATGKIISFAKALDLAAIKQKALNVAQNANPMGLLIGLVVGATSALVDHCKKTVAARDIYYDFSEEQKKVINNAKDAREKMKELDEEFGNSALEIDIQTSKTEDLWRELQSLATHTGYVNDANRARADYILGELNNALGTEYELNGNIIGQYQQMREEVDKLIKQKQAERLLKANEESYLAAQANVATFESEAYINKQAIDDNAKELETAWLELYRYAIESGKRHTFEMHMQEAGFGYGTFDLSDADAFNAAFNITEDLFGSNSYEWLGAVESAQNNLAAANEAYAKSLDSLNEAKAIAGRYEGAEEAYYIGDYEKSIALIGDEVSARWEAAREKKRISEQEQKQMKEDLDKQQHLLEVYRKNLDAGMEGYSVAEYIGKLSRFDRDVRFWEMKSQEAYEIGENIAQAIAEGIYRKALAAEAAMGDLVNRVFIVGRNTAEIASPSKRAIRDGKFIAEGLAIGLEKNGGAAVAKARELTSSLLSALSVDASAVDQNIFAPASMLTATNRPSNTYNHSTSLGGIAVYVNAPNVSDVSQLAELVAVEINDRIAEKVAIYS